nr:hypothetical protein [uncultured Pedobacter sp.]
MFEFVEYIKNPIWIAQNKHQSLKEKLSAVVKILIITYSLLLVTSLVIGLFDYLIVQDILKLPSFLNKTASTLNDFKHQFSDKYFILIVLAGPLFEELIFRLPLDLNINTI